MKASFTRRRLNFLTKPFLAALLLVAILPACKMASEKTEREEEFDDMDKIMKQEFMMAVDPALGYVPTERKFRAADAMYNLFALSRTNNFTWQERGPLSVAGRVRAIIIDRRDPSGNTLFAGGVGGGIWKCTNFKSTPTWTPINDQFPNMAITCMYQDPSNPEVIYAGTGEGWFNFDAIRGNGIFKTTDGGNTWNLLPSTQSSATSGNFDYVQDIIVTSTGVVYAASRSIFCNNGGVLRSTDGGTSWTRVIGTFPTGSTSCNDALNFRGADLEIASNGDLYATTGFQSAATQNLGRIWKSPASLGATQGTAGTWTEITPTGTWRRIEVALAPSNPNVVYALLQAGSNNAIGGIRRSDDGGQSWVTLPLPTWCDQGATSTDFTRTQAWYDLIARVDPSNASVCYIGGVDILKTVDGGNNWTQVTQWNVGCSGLPQIHADIHEILFFPGSNVEMLAGTDGGIYYTFNAGTNWLNKNDGFRITQFYAVDHHPTNANYFLAGSQDNGTQRFNFPGLNNTVQVVGGDGAFCHIDQTDGQIQIASVTGNNYRYSRNGGATWAVVSGGSSASGRFINPSDYDDELDVLYTAHNADVYGIVNGLVGTGTPVFSAITISAALNGRQISAVKVDPNYPAQGVVYFAGSTSESSGTGLVPNIIRLRNAHNTATTELSTLLPLGAGAYISSIDVETGNPNHVVVTASNYGVNSVLESFDAGVSWTNIEGNLPDIPVRWAWIAPPTALLNGPTGGAGGIAVGTELGVWSTSQTTGARTWVPNNNNFVNTRVDMLKYRPSDNTLSAGTHGRGLFTTQVPGVVTSVNPVINTKGFISYISNTKQQLLVKTGNLTGLRNITINIVDVQGRLVQTHKLPYTTATLNISGLSPGMYVVKIFGDNKERFTGQFIK